MNYPKALVLSSKIFLTTFLCFITCFDTHGMERKNEQKRSDPLEETIPEIPRSSAYDKTLDEALRRANIYGAAQASYEQAMFDYKNSPAAIKQKIKNMQLIKEAMEPTLFRSALNGLWNIAGGLGGTALNIAAQVGSAYAVMELQKHARESEQEEKEARMTPQMKKMREQTAIQAMAMQQHMTEEKLRQRHLENLAREKTLVKEFTEWTQANPDIVVDPQDPQSGMKHHIIKNNISNATLGLSFKIGQTVAPQMYQQMHQPQMLLTEDEVKEHPSAHPSVVHKKHTRSKKNADSAPNAEVVTPITVPQAAAPAA